MDMSSTLAPAVTEIFNVTLQWTNDSKSTTEDSLIDTNRTDKSISELLYNGTGFYIEGETEIGLNDLQTVFLACFITLVSLAVSLFAAFGIKLLWYKYKTRKENSQYDGILSQDCTSESLNKRPLHSHLLGDKDCDKIHVAITADDAATYEEHSTSELNNPRRANNHSTTNGSIITMTLKNNHLIVETEERNDIEEDSRETKMKYCPSARDGVFVVEVQQGVKRSPSTGGGGTTVSCTEHEISVSVSDQCALVHNPPDRYSDEETLEECDDSEYYIETSSQNPDISDSSGPVRTGLTQSSTSLNHISYSYSTQKGYDNGCYGYDVFNCCEDDTNERKPYVEDTRPKITAAVYKSSLKRSPSSENLHLAACPNGTDNGE